MPLLVHIGPAITKVVLIYIFNMFLVFNMN